MKKEKMKPKLVNQNNSGGRKSFYLKSTDHNQRQPTVMGIKAEQPRRFWFNWIFLAVAWAQLAGGLSWWCSLLRLFLLMLLCLRNRLSSTFNKVIYINLCPHSPSSTTRSSVRDGSWFGWFVSHQNVNGISHLNPEILPFQLQLSEICPPSRGEERVEMDYI